MPAGVLCCSVADREARWNTGIRYLLEMGLLCVSSICTPCFPEGAQKSMYTQSFSHFLLKISSVIEEDQGGRPSNALGLLLQQD